MDKGANEIGSNYKAKTKTISYVISWDGLLTKFHKKYLKELNVCFKIEAYIQGLTLQKTLELISFGIRRATDENEKKKMTKGFSKNCAKL